MEIKNNPLKTFLNKLNLVSSKTETNYNDYQLIPCSKIDEVAEHFSKHLNNKTYTLNVNFDEIYLLLKENIRILKFAMQVYYKKRDKYNFQIIEKITVKCEVLENFIKPYCINQQSILSKTEIKKKLPVCVINFATIIAKLFNYNNLEKFSILNVNTKETNTYNIFELQEKIIKTCLQSIIDLQSIN